MFADDVKVGENPSNDTLQTDLDTISRWTVNWDLPLNVGKWKLLIALHSVGFPRFLLANNTPSQAERGT